MVVIFAGGDHANQISINPFKKRDYETKSKIQLQRKGVRIYP